MVVDEVNTHLAAFAADHQSNGTRSEHKQNYGQSMKVLVTGGTGLLATHIIKQLVHKGVKVKCTVRDKSKFRLPSHGLIELVEGDICDADFVTHSSAGCEYIIHAAAQTPGIITDKKIFERVNVTGTANVMRAAVKNAIRKVIYVSTANTIGYGTASEPGYEALYMKKPFTWSEYALTKQQAEQLVLSYKGRMEVVIVNPTFLLGSHIDSSGSGQLLYRAYKKKILFYPPGGKNIVHVEDVATAIVKAMEKGRNGERYLLSGDNVSFKKFYQLAASENNKMASLLIPLPRFLLQLAGGIGSVLNAFGVKTNITFANVSIFLINNHYTNRKAVNELQVTFRSSFETIKDSVRWIEQHQTNRI
jgi:nucleoside-diphosphate-sugar epimerase